MSLANYTAAFDRLAAELPLAERETRAAHLRAFVQAGFPHRKMEEWRYTDLSGLADKSFALADKATTDLSALSLPNTAESIFINGQGATSSSLAVSEGSVVALNAAFARAGFVLELDAKEITSQPHNIITWCEGTQPTMAHLRHRIVLGANAEATVILQHAGRGEYLTTQVMDIELGPGSRLTLYRVQDESAQSHHLAQTSARLARDSHLQVVTIDLGSGLARHDLNVALDGAGAQAHLHGLYAPAGHAHVDNHTRVHHRAPHGTSREFFRGVVGESAKAVFNGKIVVHEGAVKTDSEQRVANLLLSPKAEVNAKPELEIYNDDVKCAHGATFGQLDEDAIYYLRARGLDRDSARGLLTYTFAHEVLARIGHPGLRRRASLAFLNRIPRGESLAELL